MVYILRFETPLGSERHRAEFYVGWCAENGLERRLKEHRNGTGAAMTRFASAAGIGFEVVATLPGATRDDERRIKKMKNTRRVLDRIRRGTFGSRAAAKF